MNNIISWDREHLEMLWYYLRYNKQIKKGGCNEQQSKRTKVELWSWPKPDSKKAREILMDLFEESEQEAQKFNNRNYDEVLTDLIFTKFITDKLLEEV